MTHPWHAAAASQIGSVHVRDGIPSQDAQRTVAHELGAVIVVADGHGHQAHFRSATGSELAAACAATILNNELETFRDVDEVQRRLFSVVGPAVVEAWRAAVLEHASTFPFSEFERTLLGGTTMQDILHVYGTTLIAMAASPSVVAVLQVGDGDAVLAYTDGRVEQPLPPDEELDGVRTTSLCQPDPLRSLRCTARDVAADGIALGFVCTDGFGSARVDADGWWRRVGGELLQHSREHDFDWIAAKMPSWLDEPAQFGGDDTTLAVLIRGDREAT